MIILEVILARSVLVRHTPNRMRVAEHFIFTEYIIGAEVFIIVIIDIASA